MIIAFLISILAFTYSYILTQPGEIFSSLYLKLDILFKNDKRMIEGKGMHPIFKLLIGCPKCVSGQLSLWYFVLNNFENLTYKLIFDLPLFVALTIFLTCIISLIYNKLTQWN